MCACPPRGGRTRSSTTGGRRDRKEGSPGRKRWNLGVQAWESCSPASACSLSQELGGSGFDTIGSARCPTLQDSELCTTESGDRRRGSPDEPGTLLLCYKSILLLC